ncbi:MAG: cytochrome c class [Gemmatimonadetes bacterium]|nr:cytochrome c class [Gemmatimonadota bacterium]
MRAAALLSVLAVATALAACEREARRFETTVPSPGASAPESPRVGALQPATPQQGGVKLSTVSQGPYEGNAFAVNQGKRLFRWYNCNGCHAMGGGSIGPALMDDQWKYGSSSSAIFASIMQGRPEGMPSFGGHITDDQAWQIVAYVRSMSGQLRKDVEPSRGDTLSGGEPEVARKPEKPRPADPPPQPPVGSR